MSSESKENVPATVMPKEENHSSHSPPTKDAQSSPKRKASEGTSNTPTTEKADHDDKKKKRRKVNHACVYCRRSHMTCDLERPCARCVKRDIGHLCHDEPRDPPKRSKSEVGTAADLAHAGSDHSHVLDTPTKTEMLAANGNGIHGPFREAHANGEGPTLVQPRPLSPSRLVRRPTGAGNTLVQNLDWGNATLPNQFQDIHHLHPNFNMFNTNEVTQEYNVLNDFLVSNLFDNNTSLFNDDASQTLFPTTLVNVNGLQSSDLDVSATNTNTANPTTSSATTTNMGPPNPAQSGTDISRPSSTFPIDNRAREKFYLTAADPSGSSSAEERLHKLLKAKHDAGMLKPWNYVNGYARLNQYMSQHLSSDSQKRVLQQLSGFRPGFRKAMHSLTDMQLLLVEMWFERSLFEYDRVFASMAVPACCWRRTGEVFRANTEMAELLHLPHDRLRDGKIAIHEVMAEESLVSYWEKFAAIAFDSKQKAILTSCTLRRPVRPADWNLHHTPATATAMKTTINGGGKGLGEMAGGGGVNGKGGEQTEMIRCCFSFTIRRDSHNIPSLIVGNFLPINERVER